MDISLKYQIVEKIIQSEDDIVLNQIKALLNVPETDFWNDLPIELKQAINKAKGEFDRGEGIPHEKVMEEIRSRFLNQ